MIYAPIIASDEKISSIGQGEEYSKLDQYFKDLISRVSINFSEEIFFENDDIDYSIKSILKIISSHQFNHQSRGKIAHLIPSITDNFERSVKFRTKLPIYLLLHGGYRAAVGGSSLSHVFAPDITELMLIYQVSLLQRRVRAVYPPGIRFCLVINNGVAAFTNGIPYEKTDLYVSRLRALIARLGAQETIWVLNQSELGDFAEKMRGIDITPKPGISASEHAIVERFLGRECSVEEACFRAAAYEKAESVWGQEIRAIVAGQSGIFCRQVAHPDCISFRAFPGGAIRIQNGTVGFRIEPKGPVPCFVTPVTWGREETKVVPMRLPLFDGLHPSSVALAEEAGALG